MVLLTGPQNFYSQNSFSNFVQLKQNFNPKPAKSLVTLEFTWNLDDRERKRKSKAQKKISVLKNKEHWLFSTILRIWEVKSSVKFFDFEKDIK